MKQIMTTIPMAKAKIHHLEVETKRLTGYTNAHRNTRLHFFDELSMQWLSAYSYLNDVASEMEREEYKQYLQKLYDLRDMITNYAILCTQNGR